jgi:hypothetical protein
MKIHSIFNLLIFISYCKYLYLFIYNWSKLILLKTWHCWDGGSMLYVGVVWATVGAVSNSRCVDGCAGPGESESVHCGAGATSCVPTTTRPAPILLPTPGPPHALKALHVLARPTETTRTHGLYIHLLYVLVSKILSSILNSPAPINPLYHPLYTLSTVGSTFHFI